MGEDCILPGRADEDDKTISARVANYAGVLHNCFRTGITLVTVYESSGFLWRNFSLLVPMLEGAIGEPSIGVERGGLVRFPRFSVNVLQGGDRAKCVARAAQAMARENRARRSVKPVNLFSKLDSTRHFGDADL